MQHDAAFSGYFVLKGHFTVKMAYRGYMRGCGIRGRGRMGSRVLARTVIRSDSNMYAMLANQDGNDDDDSVLLDSDSENLKG